MISYIDDGALRFQVFLMQKRFHIRRSLVALDHKVSPLNFEDPRSVSKESYYSLTFNSKQNCNIIKTITLSRNDSLPPITYPQSHKLKAHTHGISVELDTVICCRLLTYQMRILLPRSKGENTFSQNEINRTIQIRKQLLDMGPFLMSTGSSLNN